MRVRCSFNEYDRFRERWLITVQGRRWLSLDQKWQKDGGSDGNRSSTCID